MGKPPPLSRRHADAEGRFHAQDQLDIGEAVPAFDVRSRRAVAQRDRIVIEDGVEKLGELFVNLVSTQLLAPNSGTVKRRCLKTN